VRLFAAPALATRALDGGEGASYGVAWLFPAVGGLAGLVVVILGLVARAAGGGAVTAV
jgi:hypothetical protein